MIFLIYFWLNEYKKYTTLFFYKHLNDKLFNLLINFYSTKEISVSGQRGKNHLTEM